MACGIMLCNPAWPAAACRAPAVQPRDAQRSEHETRFGRTRNRPGTHRRHRSGPTTPARLRAPFTRENSDAAAQQPRHLVTMNGMMEDEEKQIPGVDQATIASMYNPRDDKWRTSTSDYAHMKACVTMKKDIPRSRHDKPRPKPNPLREANKAVLPPAAAGWDRMTVAKLQTMCSIYQLPITREQDQTKYPTARGELAAVRQVPLRKRELIAQLNEYTQKGWPTWENSFQRDGQNPLRLEDLDKKKKNNADLTASDLVEFPNVPSPRRRGKFDKVTGRHTVSRFG